MTCQNSVGMVVQDIAKDTPVSKHYSGADVFDL